MLYCHGHIAASDVTQDRMFIEDEVSCSHRMPSETQVSGTCVTQHSDRAHNRLHKILKETIAMLCSSMS